MVQKNEYTFAAVIKIMWFPTNFFGLNRNDTERPVGIEQLKHNDNTALKLEGMELNAKVFRAQMHSKSFENDK